MQTVDATNSFLAGLIIAFFALRGVGCWFKVAFAFVDLSIGAKLRVDHLFRFYGW